jgi:hypothetical protein
MRTIGSGGVDLEYIAEMMKRDKKPMRIVELNSPLGGSKSKDDRIERINNDLIPLQMFVPWPTDPDRLTKEQRAAVQQGNGMFLSKQIKQIGQDRTVYDLTEVFRKQLSHFPLGSQKDLIDAVSRIYDMSITDPVHRQGSYEVPVEHLI